MNISLPSISSFQKFALWTAIAITGIVGINSCGQQMPENVAEFQAEFPNVPTYHIFVRSYADSDGNGIGDYKGIIGKLDYLQKLGIKNLWLMPVFASPSYHKYDVIDFYKLDPEYGTDEDFKALIDSAHGRGMKVILDFVINHTAYDHPWFVSARNDTNSPYRNFYVWAKSDNPEAQPIEGKTMGWIRHNEQFNYFAHFWEKMPDLNFDNPAVRDTIKAITRYWIDKFPLDGFRLDAVMHIYPQKEKDKSVAWWKEFNEYVQSLRPNFLLVGEVWDRDSVIAPYYSAIPSNFNFDLALAIEEAVYTANDKVHRGWYLHSDAPPTPNTQRFLQLWQKTYDRYKAVNPKFLDAIFITNHDQDRVMSDMRGNIAKAKLCASILLTMPGVPYIYYGEEIGMVGKYPHENIREPMLWDPVNQDKMRTTWRISEHNTDEQVPPVSVQMADSSSLLHHYMRLLSLRNSSRALTLGSLEPLSLVDEDMIAYRRLTEQERLVVLHNLTPTEKEFTLPSDVEMPSLLYNGNGSSLEGSTVRLQPRSTVIIRY